MLKPIKTQDECDIALERFYKLMQSNNVPNSKESDELEILSILIKEFESNAYKLPKPNPIEAIRFRLEQKNMSEKDLAVVLGYRSRKSEILSGKRKLSLSMIRKLNEELNIPATSLFQSY
jgi:HTH-type transcriptional regulator/antitoxin HigA